MSILSAIARNLLRQEMSNRAEKKKHCFAIRNHYVGIEIVCRGDWQDTHAPNFDLQLWSQQLGVYLGAYGYALEQVRFKGGAQWLFTDQNDQLLRKRQNVKVAEEQKKWEDDEKIVFRAMYQADYKNTTFLYDF